MRQRCLDLNIKYRTLFMTDYSFGAQTHSHCSLHAPRHCMCKIGSHRSTLHMKRNCLKLAGHKKYRVLETLASNTGYSIQYSKLRNATRI